MLDYDLDIDVQLPTIQESFTSDEERKTMKVNKERQPREWRAKSFEIVK
jgi:hypothetical protein